MGGPLDNGDIEDYGGRTCVRCPWHAYPFSLLFTLVSFSSSLLILILILILILVLSLSLSLSVSLSFYPFFLSLFCFHLYRHHHLFSLILESYVITLETGEGLYRTVENTVKSKGLKQRTHIVKIEDENIYLVFLFYF